MREEDQIQQAIIDYIAWCAPSVLAFAIPNASIRTKSGRASNAVAGLRPGVWDIGVLLPDGWHSNGYMFGVTAYIEVKTKTGRLSEEQREFAGWLRRGSIPHVVARSIDDVRQAFLDWGVPIREVRPPIGADTVVVVRAVG